MRADDPRCRALDPVIGHSIRYPDRCDPHLGGTRHESKLRAVIEHYTDVEVIGAVQHDVSLQIAERHLDWSRQ